MNNIVKTVIFALFLTGCASYRPIFQPAKKTNTATKKVSRPVHEQNKTPVKPLEHYAIWDLLKSSKVSLQLTNVDDGSNLTVIIENGLSQRDVPPGHWELTGFEEDGTSFVSMNTSKKFVFRMNPKKNVYAGTILIGCPKIATDDLKLLREMKYFNRYHFSSSVGLCELVVGNDFANVWLQVSKSRKSKKLNLINGL